MCPSPQYRDDSENLLSMSILIGGKRDRSCDQPSPRNSLTFFVFLIQTGVDLISDVHFRTNSVCLGLVLGLELESFQGSIHVDYL